MIHHGGMHAAVQGAPAAAGQKLEPQVLAGKKYVLLFSKINPKKKTETLHYCFAIGILIRASVLIF